MKPRDNYFISETEKQRIIDEIIKPKAVIAVQTQIIDPEYLYIVLDIEAQYDSKKTSVFTYQNGPDLKYFVILKIKNDKKKLSFAIKTS